MSAPIRPFTRRAALAGLVSFSVVGCESVDSQVLGDILGSVGGVSGSGGLSQADAALGIREALKNGVSASVSQVGRVDGYLKDSIIKILLPDNLRQIQSSLAQFGLSGMLDELQVQLNRGAEKAAPLARNIFIDAITSLSIQDAISIVRGPNDAATQYLKKTTTGSLTTAFSPIMDNALQQTGALKTLDNLDARLSTLPIGVNLGANAKRDLISWGVEKGLDGIFHYVGQEEAAIRSNPAKRTSEILRKVFG